MGGGAVQPGPRASTGGVKEEGVGRKENSASPLPREEAGGPSQPTMAQTPVRRHEVWEPPPNPAAVWGEWSLG